MFSRYTSDSFPKRLYFILSEAVNETNLAYPLNNIRCRWPDTFSPRAPWLSSFSVFHVPLWLFFLGLLWGLLRPYLFPHCLCPWGLGLGCPLFSCFTFPLEHLLPCTVGFNYCIVSHTMSLYTRLIDPNAKRNPGLPVSSLVLSKPFSILCQSDLPTHKLDLVTFCDKDPSVAFCCS